MTLFVIDILESFHLIKKEVFCAKCLRVQDFGVGCIVPRLDYYYGEL